MNKVLPILIAVTLISFGCSSGKYVHDFKNIKKTIGTIEVLPVNIEIKTLDFFKKQEYDHKLEKVVKADIFSQIKDVLGPKYKIVAADTTINYDQLYFDLERMRFFIATQSNPLKNEEAPFSFQNIKSNLKSRYILVLLVRSQYCINYPDRMNNVWMDPLLKTYLNQYLYLIDKETNKILFFKKSNSEGDVSIKLSVEQVTLESIQNLYYK